MLSHRQLLLSNRGSSLWLNSLFLRSIPLLALKLEDALARVPQWAGANNLKVTPLGGGITNNNYRIDIGGKAFVLRIAGADIELLVPKK